MVAPIPSLSILCWIGRESANRPETSARHRPLARRQFAVFEIGVDIGLMRRRQIKITAKTFTTEQNILVGARVQIVSAAAFLSVASARSTTSEFMNRHASGVRPNKAAILEKPPAIWA